MPALAVDKQTLVEDQARAWRKRKVRVHNDSFTKGPNGEELPLDYRHEVNGTLYEIPAGKSIVVRKTEAVHIRGTYHVFTDPITGKANTNLPCKLRIEEIEQYPTDVTDPSPEPEKVKVFCCEKCLKEFANKGALMSHLNSCKK